MSLEKMMKHIPTFDEFSQNPDKWLNKLLGRDDEVLASVDNGSQNLKHHVKRYKFEIEGYKCATIEEVERIAKDKGIPLRELKYEPHVIPQGGGSCDILVKFVARSEIQRRDLWK